MPDSTPSKASRRASANRAKGIRFERSIARKLRAAGFEVRRNLEYDGFGCGIDLLLYARDPVPTELGHVWRRLPVALQCKAVNNPHAWKAGLAEANKAMPDADLWACIHSYQRTIKVWWMIDDQPEPDELQDFIGMLANRYLP